MTSNWVSWPRWQKALAGLAVIAIALFGLDRVFPPPIESVEVSQWVTDREGRPLRAFPTAERHWRFPVDLDTIDPVFVDALIAVEDKRFHQHWGVDWVAMVRAAVTSAQAGRIVSGGSTLTMQTARLLEPRPRTIGSKLIEMVRAHQIEARLSKQEILELYLTLAPYGGNLEGIRAASWRYFGHGPDALGDDEIALLIALPQSPEMRRPDRRPDGAKAGRDWVANKLHSLGVLSQDRLAEVRNTAVQDGRNGFPNRAWHASATARNQSLTADQDVRSTLDGPLQAELERLLGARVDALPDEVQMAALVVDVSTRSVRAAVGSAQRGRPGGWIDLTTPSRSPGSTLKPFIYGLAFDDGVAAPTTVIADLPKRFAAYQPDNFDRTFRGDVTIAEALQHSLNVPAVLALAEVGPDRFAAVLRQSGTTPVLPRSAESDAGLALALGGIGMSARDLAVLYAGLADGGVAKPLRWQESADQPSHGYRMMGAESAERILSILKAAPTPTGRVPGRLTTDAPDIAFKTGTSYGFRDAWAAGVSGDHVIVVWVGRADGAPRPGETGRKAALPVLFEIADRSAHHLGREESGVERLLANDLGRARAAQRVFQDEAPPEILFPPANAELWAGPVDGRPSRAFVLSGRGASALQWYIDGEPCAQDAAGLPIWRPETAGFYRITAVDRDGRTSHARVRVIGAPPA